MQLRYLIELPTLHYNQLIILGDKVIIQAQIPKKTAVCPICNNRSNKVHSFYIREVRDLSICGKETHIHLKTRRFFCKNKYCTRMIFCEQSSDLMPYKRLSKRALNVLSKTLIEVSAHKGSIISRNIGLGLSSSSCLRLVHSLILPPINQVIHLGVDDWALRKGCTYGTAIDIRRTSLFDSYLSTIQRELSKGTCLNRIYRLIVEEGYKGARSNFYLNFDEKNLLNPNPFCKTMSMSSISKYMFSENITKIHNKVEKLQMQILCERIDWFLPLNKLCSSFSKILRSGTKKQLDEWLKKVHALNLTGLKRFVSGIHKDYKAVLNAVLYPSSSGVVEGNINRLKNIKRQMYGRAGLELLKRKVILSASG
jgi:hypothetical protein